MARWLVKEEPTHYSYGDLERDGGTDWTGVHNALALRHLRAMAVGDEIVYYHTGGERAAVGVAVVTEGPQPDREDPRGSWRVRLGPVRRLARPVSLAEMRGDPAFEGFDLLRIGRLSILPVQDEHWAALLARAARTTEGPALPARRAVARRPRAAARRRPRRATASGAGPRRSARRSGRGRGS